MQVHVTPLFFLVSNILLLLICHYTERRSDSVPQYFLLDVDAVLTGEML